MKKLSHAVLVGIVLAPLSLASTLFANGGAPGLLSEELGKCADTETAYTKTVSELAIVESEDFATYTVEGIEIVKESFGSTEDYKASEGGAVIQRGVELKSADALKLRAQKAIPDPVTMSVVFAAMALSLSLYKKGK